MTDWDVIDQRLFRILAQAYDEGYAQGAEDAAQGERSAPNPFLPPHEQIQQMSS